VPSAGAAGAACTYIGAAGAAPNVAAAIKDVGTPPATARRTGKATMRLTTSQGPIVISMDAKAAPCAVASFAYLAGKHFFDNTKCHRLTTEGIWVLQCGDPSATGYGGPAYNYAQENLGPKYTRGTVAVANTGQPNSSGSQFFVNYKDNLSLGPDYTMLGTVTAGMDVVDKVAAGGATPADVNAPGDGAPKVEIVLQQVTVTYD
jgi:peptidyl-prolyl cis-trans isomerase B (cyclophilin B)